MKSVANFLSVLAILGAVASGVFFFLSSSDKSRIEEDLQSVQTLLQAERNRVAQLKKDLESSQTSEQQSSKSLEEARSNITVITARSNQLNREKKRYTEELERRLENEENLQRALADLRKEMAELRATTISLSKAESYEQTITSLESEVERLKNLQRTTTTANPAALPPNAKLAPANLEGKILTVGPQSSFVITNLGYTSGIRLDHLLSIVREGETVAQLQITEVKENLSIARILPESLKTDPIPGDSVVSGNL
jgi:myosin heavy subunit